MCKRREKIDDYRSLLGAKIRPAAGEKFGPLDVL